MAFKVKPASGNRYSKVVSKPGRVDLIPEEFESIIEAQGSYVRITPSMICPNKTSLEDTNHNLDCPICLGDEVVDLCDQSVEDWAIIQSINLDKKFDVRGLFDMKDAQLTVRQGIRLFYWYKVEVVDFSSVFNQLVKREAGGDFDRVRYNPATSCDTPFYCIDSENIRYYVNQDFRFDGDRRVRWLGLKRPATGSLYSLTYPILPTFRVIEMMHENRYYYTSFRKETKTPVNLPQQALIRWDYIAKGSGANLPLRVEGNDG